MIADIAERTKTGELLFRRSCTFDAMPHVGDEISFTLGQETIVGKVVIRHFRLSDDPQWPTNATIGYQELRRVQWGKPGS